jgi:hypothetical protein
MKAGEENGIKPKLPKMRERYNGGGETKRQENVAFNKTCLASTGAASQTQSPELTSPVIPSQSMMSRMIIAVWD